MNELVFCPVLVLFATQKQTNLHCTLFAVLVIVFYLNCVKKNKIHRKQTT